MKKRNNKGSAVPYLAHERGVALVITLFVVALVTVLVLEYHFDASVEIDLAANYASDVQAYYLAVSGINFARALLLRDERDTDGTDDLWYRLGLIPACFPPQELLSMSGETEVAPLLSGEIEESVKPVSSETGCVSLRIVDEQSKLPINALMPASGSEDPDPIWRDIFTAFFTAFQIEPDTLDALIDWIDRDDVPRGIGGAEDAYYEGLENAYTAPDEPMRALGELRLIRGFTYETLAKLFPGLPPEAVADADLGGNSYLAAYPPDKQSKVNLNTANKEVLQALFDGLEGGGSGSTAELVEEIDAKRQESQFDGLNDVNELISDSALQTKLKQVADVKSTYFRVESIGVVGIIRKRAVAVLKRDGNDVPAVYVKVE